MTMPAGAGPGPLSSHARSKRALPLSTISACAAPTFGHPHRPMCRITSTVSAFMWS
jgi:hypothetical protein